MDLRRFLIEQQFAQQLTHLQDVAGQHLRPAKANFSYPAPPYAVLYREYLHCPCFFEQECSELHHDVAILDQEPSLARRLTSVLFQEACDTLVGKAKASSGVAGEIYQALTRSPGAFPSMEQIVKAFGMTSRTLHRRLDAENVSFSTLFEDVRRVLATEYLRTTAMSVDDIDMLVGFSDTANFRRAYKRWLGGSPSDVRAASSARSQRPALTAR